MTFEALEALIGEKRLSNYYTLLMTHADTIAREVGIRGKAKTAQAIGLNPSQFSLVYPCIVAHIEVRDHAEAK